MHILPLSLLLLTITITTAHSSPYNHRRRHLLHQPLYPVDDSLPPTQAPTWSPQPQPQPKQQPKLPFDSSSSSPSSTSASSSATSPSEKPFFPSYQYPPPPPSPTALTSFPANISSLLFPQTTTRPHTHGVAIAVTVSLLCAALIAAFAAAFLYYRRNRKLHTTSDDKTSRTDSLRLYPPNTATSDGIHKSRTTPNNSSEFLYLGTLVNSRGVDPETAANSSNATMRLGVSASPYQKLGSPELNPLPPLPKHTFKRALREQPQVGSEDEADEEEFFSPRGSTDSPVPTGSSSQREPQSLKVNFRSRSLNSRTPSYPSSKSGSPTTTASNALSPVNFSPASFKSKSPDSVINFMAPSRPPPIPLLSSPSLSSLSSRSERGSGNTQNSPCRKSDASEQKKQSPGWNGPPYAPVKLPPPPPPPPPPRFWEMPAMRPGPPPLVTPSRHVFQNSEVVCTTGAEELLNGVAVEKSSEESAKPKLKALHWDKVRASSDRAMVWDQLKSSSFQVNEEMIETLFTANYSNLLPKDNGRRQCFPSLVQEYRVLDPKKSQNIAILLRALNVTIDEVCEALLEGNADALGTELLESLLKMAPTKEEEWKLREYKDESPLKLGPAEKFLKAVLDIPFAFKRVEALLYVANFDSEIDYLKRSFHTLEVACGELRSSRMFMKLLEAVLKTGNRMNVGTNRGDAHAFKLDTLLKLVDVKGADGKTTLLHFVVQEIIRAEGLRLSGANQNVESDKSDQSSYWDDVEFRKLGLQVVSGLSGELTNVKKAAAMDSDVLSNEVAKLTGGITRVAQVLKSNEEFPPKESSRGFSEAMNGFLKKAEQEIEKLQWQEKLALSLVKDLTEYFHGNSAKEEARPLRIFLVVRDFLGILDQVCKEVGKVNERSTVGLVRQFPTATNLTVLPFFPGPDGGHQFGSSSDDETSSSSQSHSV